jgi:IS30 family transposase
MTVDSHRPTDGSVPGNWDGDLIVGPHHHSAIGTLVERQTHYGKLLHLNAGGAQQSCTPRSSVFSAGYQNTYTGP